MKRSMFGILTLVLVLAALVCVTPFALAWNTNDYVQINGVTELTLGDSATFTVRCEDIGDYDRAYEWTVIDPNGRITSGSDASYNFTATTAGTYTILVTVTYTSKSEEDKTPIKAKDSLNVSVTSGAYTVSLDRTEITAYPNQSVRLPVVTVQDENRRTVKADVTWNVSNNQGYFTASTSTKTLTPTVTVNGQTVSNVPSCYVTVVKPVLECKSTSAEVGNIGTLQASMTTQYTDPPRVTYQFSTSSSGSGQQSNNNTFTMRSSTAQVVPVTVTAYLDGNPYNQVTPITANISFYNDRDIDVTLSGSQTSFTFNSTTALTGGEALSTLMLQDLTSDMKRNATVQFTTLGSSYDAAVLTLPRGASGRSVNASSLDNVKLTVNDTYRSDFTFGYDIYGDDGLKYGAGTVTVNFTGDGGDIVYKTDYSTAVTFDEEDFEDFWNSSRSVTGTLDYVVFDVSSRVPAYGALYTTSSKSKTVTSKMEFLYDSSSSYNGYDLDAVTYVPSSSRKDAYTVEIPFTAYGVRYGQSLSGTVVIELNSDAGDIVYKTDYTSNLTFDEEDFEDFWNNSGSVTGALDYVVFGVSSRVPAYGGLYTNASKNRAVTSDMAFQIDYDGSSSYYDLDTVTYVSSSSRKDAYTVEIPFTAYGIRRGQTLSGTVVIELNSEEGDIVYETSYSSAVTFDEDDFEDFWDDAGSVTGSLRYVVFDVSSRVPAYGDLYTTTAKSKSVTSSMKFQPYYTSSSSYYDLDTVTYVPNANYTSAYTVEIPFTAYGGSNGTQTLSGTVVIKLNGTAGDIVYETDYSTAVTFDEDDFEDFWDNSRDVTGSLKYVVFDVSSKIPAYGDLYTTTSKSKSVTSSMKFQSYYTSSSGYYDLDTVTYVPTATKKDAYTVEIPFTAYGGSNGAQTLTGTVVIELNSSSTGIYSTGVVFGKGTNSVAKQIISDYENAMDADLAYVIFDLPDVEDGRLYYDYTTILDTDYVDKGDAFYVEPGKNDLDLEAVAFVPAAGRTGKVTIYYTGYDENGKNAYEGKISLNVVAKTASSCFTDVTTSSYSWAADSIDFLYYQEVVQGSGKKYSPASSITRGDFMIMLYRAFLEGKYGNYNVTSNFADVTKGTDSYSKETYQAVGVAKYLGIAQGDGTNFKPKTSITREEAMTLIYRTLDVMDLELEYSTRTSTSSFSDYSSVSSYAKTSISYLIQHGIVIGSNGKISPKSNITRAEMAVILHRVLTY